MKLLSQNKKAGYDYKLSDDLEVGINFIGLEIKSVIAGKMQLLGSYVKIINNEVFLIGSHISDIPKTLWDPIGEELRDRKLLLHRGEINKFKKKLQVPGTTLILKNVYSTNNGLIKGTLCLGQGKNVRDKRVAIKERDLKRKVQEY